MSKLILLITGYSLLYLSIITYYKINNFRVPFKNGLLGWKNDVKLKEKIIISFIINIPLFIVLFVL
ncbi:MAG: hypothetical protein CMB84_00895 [Flammeovirgaceae bacterium]|nr:hypothetical protein [Flammeovirgaceae bacterium]